jgi:iron complex outermembrane recepter protein
MIVYPRSVRRQQLQGLARSRAFAAQHPKWSARLSTALGITVATALSSLLLAAPAQADQGADATSVGALRGMSIAQLMHIEVTSVTKTAEPVSEAAAAVYVITHEDIVQSGATSIPEILRLAPNLEVFEVSPSNYVITARGFDGNSADQSFSDKLLVLIDGRSVYSPLYSGVYWDAVSVPVDDIERIEVISGPGATLWGANAVNGVINIITRKSSDTQGELLNASGGNLERDATAQAGARTSPDLTYRVYADGTERDALTSPDGAPADDGWYRMQGGFRTDRVTGADALTVEGQVYRGNETAPGDADQAISGADLLAHWEHSLRTGGKLQVLTYYDQSERFTIGGGAFVLNTYDLELQQSLNTHARNAIVWGIGERLSRYGIADTASFQFVPDSRTLNLTDAFAQDEINLTRDLMLIAGLKLERDPYSGITALPNVRISWKVGSKALLWAAVSRAIRSATPFDRDVVEYLAGTRFLVGGEQFQSEKLTAYELGVRGQINPRFSYSLSGYYNVYEDLRSIEIAGDNSILPLHWGNGMEGRTYGIELWGNYQPTPIWRISFGLGQEHEDLRFEPGSSGLLGVSQAGDDPSHQADLRSLLNITSNLTLNADLRYVGAIPQPSMPGYTELDLSLGWRVSQRWRIALSGSNLLHARHQEYFGGDFIGREFLLSTSVNL